MKLLQRENQILFTFLHVLEIDYRKFVKMLQCLF